MFDETQERRAKLLCARCPVRLECAARAIERGEEFGVWGGLGPRDRRRIIQGPTVRQMTVRTAPARPPLAPLFEWVELSL